MIALPRVRVFGLDEIGKGGRSLAAELFSRYAEISRRVEELRKSGSLTKAEISELADISEEQIGLNYQIREIGERILSGDKAPHLRKVWKKD